MHALRIIDIDGVDAGTRRLLIAAAASILLHLGILASVQRGAPGDDPQAGQGNSRVLVAQLAGPAASERTGELPPAAGEQSPMTSPAGGEDAMPPAAAQPSPIDPGIRNPGELYYFRSAELDRRPFPIDRIEVPVPESAQSLAGSVQIRLRISETGQVDDATIVMGSGIADFEAAALREFARARFHPGYRANLPVRSEMLIEVSLKPPVAGGPMPGLAPATP